MNKDNQSICQIDQFGTKRWTLNGLFHREDGPAIESAYGDEYWFLHGKYINSQKEFERLIKLKVLW